MSRESPSSPRPFAVREASGFQHANDEYYYRPLVSGKDLFTYRARPAGGGVPPDAEEAKLFELSLFMIDGELVAILDQEEFAIRPGQALMMESARSRGRRVYAPAEFHSIVGETTFPLR